MRSRPDPRQAVFDAKLKKHNDAGNACFPVVLDFTGSLFPRTLRLLQDLMGDSSKQCIGLFKRECAAAMCRMIGRLDHRNVTERTLPPTAIHLSDAEAAS